MLRCFCLGGTPESRKEFLESLSADSTDPSLPSERRKGKVPPIANQFALGYTYQDVLDADQDGTFFLASLFPTQFLIPHSMSKADLFMYCLLSFLSKIFSLDSPHIFSLNRHSPLRLSSNHS